MINELLRRFLYAQIVEFATKLTGIKPYYKTQYSLYREGPRWYIIRHLRLLWDGKRCVRCGNRSRLEMHHLDYDDKGEGWGAAEFFRLRTLCNDCHEWVHGKPSRKETR